MAITGADLISPAGVLSTTLLAEIGAARKPAEADVALIANGYAAAGVVRAAVWPTGPLQNIPQRERAWAYYLAFTERATQIAAGFASAGAAGEGNIAYSSGQSEFLGKQAAQWLGVFDTLGAAQTESAESARGASSSARVTFTY